MAEEKPHLALPDLALPDRHGIELRRDILRIADVPVIFLSVYSQPGSGSPAAGRVLCPRRKRRRQRMPRVG